jgi:hypothetical protein
VLAAALAAYRERRGLGGDERAVAGAAEAALRFQRPLV